LRVESGALALTELWIVIFTERLRLRGPRTRRNQEPVCPSPWPSPQGTAESLRTVSGGSRVVGIRLQAREMSATSLRRWLQALSGCWTFARRGRRLLRLDARQKGCDYPCLASGKG